MGNLKTKDLNKIGYIDNKLRGLAVSTIAKHFKHKSNDEILELLVSVKSSPATYANDEALGRIAQYLLPPPAKLLPLNYTLTDTPKAFKIYGEDGIEAAAIKQMELAMALPISVQGALMPDAHSGYGLPIGAVLATQNAVIPYGVGVDIGCRMALSIVDAGDNFLQRYAHQAEQALNKFTHFGMDGGLEISQDHDVLDDAAFGETALLRKLHGKAAIQLGSSGGGNHFVEFGELELFTGNTLGLPAKKYVALLSHSGSRGLGATIAKHYTQIAMNTCKLPRHAQQLAWLNLDTEAGQEYWLSMTLAGDYARACHDRIHANLLRALGLKPLAVVQNHHNFAWKDLLADGREVVVHRKGATPAHAGELGIIPGSMATPAYLVMGKGVGDALQSASHGAGRAQSRQEARQGTTNSAMKKMLLNAGVTLIGGSLEENPFAYKDIESVMNAQSELVAIQGKFLPRIVRMSAQSKGGS